jgi:hypothetical protein
LDAVLTTALGEPGLRKSRKSVNRPTIRGQRQAYPVEKLWQPVAPPLSPRGVRDNKPASGTQDTPHLGKRLGDLRPRLDIEDNRELATTSRRTVTSSVAR